ncbi:hypothetical protein NEUTE2DRAFT_91216 [Neurospora tetrasperma FGSC 2509]|nr:hypothetical protein NEUTE2DRAFT_91216 [Neurospora tetrasperma FGSC 2509]
MGREGPGEGCLGALVPGAVGQEGVLGQDCDMAQRKRTISAAPNTRKADDSLCVNEWKSSNKFGDCVVTTPQQDVIRIQPTTPQPTWLRNMTTPASQPHFDIQIFSLFMRLNTMTQGRQGSHQPLIGARIDGFDLSNHDHDKNQYSRIPWLPRSQRHCSVRRRTSSTPSLQNSLDASSDAVWAWFVG